MTSNAYVSHQIVGRARLRVPEKRGDANYFEAVRQKLSAEAGVEAVQVSPQTGSILIHHKGPLAPIVAAASGHDLFRIADQATVTATRPNPIKPPGAARNAVATGLSGLALVQLARGQAFGSAVENFWHAYGSKRFLQRPALAGLFAAIGAYQLLRGRYLGSATSLFFYAMVTRQLALSERQEGSRERIASKAKPEVPRPPSHKRAEIVFPRRA
jgi:hypothetical protein